MRAADETCGAPALSATSAMGVARRAFAGRYELIETLKSGNGVDAFLARDAVTGLSVVIKSIDPAGVHPTVRLRFEHETQVLRELTQFHLTGLRRSSSASNATLPPCCSCSPSWRRPIDHVLLLDDCQWADTLTVRLLGRPVRPARCTGLPWGHRGFRSEEVAADHALRDITGAQAMHLGPLDGASMDALAESMAGRLPEQALRTVTRLADGSPFMAAAVLRGLVEYGALKATTDGWVIDETALGDVQTGRSAAAFLVTRLELLSDDALGLLSAGAILDTCDGSRSTTSRSTCLSYAISPTLPRTRRSSVA